MRVTAGGDDNPLFGHLNLELKEGAANARPTGAFTAIWFVEGTVGPADEQPAVVIEELVWPPIERCSGRQIP